MLFSFHTSDLLVLDIITPTVLAEYLQITYLLLYCILLLFVTSGRDDTKREIPVWNRIRVVETVASYFY